MNDQSGLSQLGSADDEGRSKLFERALDTFDRARLPNSETGVNVSHNPTHGGYPTPMHLRDEDLAGAFAGPDIFTQGPSSPIPGSEWTALVPDRISEFFPDPADPDGINTVVAETIAADDTKANNAKIAAEIVAAGGPRANGFNYGSGWIGAKPDAYFDGVRLNNQLSARNRNAGNRQWALETALRNVRLAETETERALTVLKLQDTMHNILTDDPDLNIERMVDDIINTVEAVAPFEPKGYVRNMNLAHAVHPIHKALRNLRAYLNSFKG